MMTNKEIDTKVKKYLQLQGKIAALKNEADNIRRELESELESRSIDTLTTNSHVVKCLHYTQSRFDSKQFATEHSKLFARYQKESNCTRFTVQ